MAISKFDLKVYLTSIEPGIEQTIYSQSIGGYPGVVLTDLTKSLLYPETFLTSETGYYEKTLTVNDFSQLSSKPYLHANGEIIKPFDISSAVVSIDSRAVNSAFKMHIGNDIIHGIDASNGLFNNNFNSSYKQYRCVAVRNNNAIDTAFNTRVYLKQKSRNINSTVRIAIEVPKNDRRVGTVTSDSANKITLRDIALIGIMPNNFCTDANIRFISGPNINQQRIINSFDTVSGIFVLNSSLPYSPAIGDQYEIQPGPSQRVSSGIAPPIIGSGRVTSWLTPGADNTVSININGLRENEEDMLTRDVFYIWFERSLNKESVSFSNNDIIFAVIYSEV